MSLQGQKNAITVQQLDERHFLTMQDQWRNLLARSNADPLFMGWEWLSAWWETWSQPLALELFLFAAFEGETLVGVAPFFRRKRRLPAGNGVTELHLLGNAWRIAPTVRTEYVDLIVDRHLRTTVVEALAEAMQQQHWDLMVVCDHVASGASSNLQLAADCLSAKHMPRRSEPGIRIDTAGNFSDWLARLGPNTRLKAYNRRQYLAKSGRTISLVPETDYGKALAILNRLHLARWGKPCFANESLAFHHRFLDRLGPGSTVHLTGLYLDGGIRSLLYDVHLGDTVYNLQAGFDEHFDPKVSLGTLHLGFAIEAAFADPEVHHYDLLAGLGKTSFYKARFQGTEIRFENSLYLRAPWLKAAAAVYEILPQRLSRGFGKWIDDTPGRNP
ncbi:MAG: GNAT family N-acetyltransferase [Aquisalimonadaceae bacterium]